jgi:hypothetical protein
MTPKEKAKELFDKCMKTECCVITKEHSIPSIICDQITYKTAQKFALIAVNEMIKVACDESDYDKSVTKAYLLEVKQEIGKL